jgi:hypothetical protein
MWLNTKILANPYNWVIVLALVVLGVCLFREIGRLFETGYSATKLGAT